MLESNVSVKLSPVRMVLVEFELPFVMETNAFEAVPDAKRFGVIVTTGVMFVLVLS